MENINAAKIKISRDERAAISRHVEACYGVNCCEIGRDGSIRGKAGTVATVAQVRQEMAQIKLAGHPNC